MVNKTTPEKKRKTEKDNHKVPVRSDSLPKSVAQLGELLRHEKLHKRIRIIERRYSGPLPPADEFKQYTSPAQNTILKVFRAGHKFREKITTRQQKHDHFLAKFELLSSYALKIISFGAAYLSFSAGLPTLASVSFLAFFIILIIPILIDGLKVAFKKFLVAVLNLRKHMEDSQEVADSPPDKLKRKRHATKKTTSENNP